MAAETYYTNTYPELSATITKKEFDGSIAARNSIGPKGVCERTWSKAHEHLRMVADHRLQKAAEEYKKAVDHYNLVLMMRDPDLEE